MIKAALYVRVSTEEQANEGYSIAAQISALNAYCEREGISVYKIYADEGVSGQKENRPQFQAMIKDAESGLFQVIFVHKFDRFARKIELSQKVKNKVRNLGINVISITEPVENSPIGFFQEGLMDLLAEYYVRNLSQESKKGLIERASRGLHNGQIPYGYLQDGENMLPAPETANVVKLIFEKYVEDGWGIVKIAKYLNDMGVKSIKGIGKWRNTAIRRILTNIKYVGKIYYNGQIYDGKHEPLVSEEVFNLAHNALEKKNRNKASYRGKNAEKFLLIGLLKCKYCSGVFRIHVYNYDGKKRKNTNHYYRCGNAAMKDFDRCSFKKHYRVEELTYDIVQLIEQVKDGIIVPAAVESSVDTGGLLENQETKLNVELERAKTAYLAGIFSLEEYQKEKTRICKQLEEIENAKNELSKDYKQKILREKINTLWDEFENAETISSKRAILQKFIKSIYIKDDEIDIKYYI